jgi:hypothetical protein
LISLFVPRADGTKAMLPTPGHLFGSRLGPHSHSERPLETLQPLSERLALPIDSSYLQDDLEGLEGAIRRCDGNVLVAWEHKRIPLLAARLVTDRSLIPMIWPDDRYDVIWILEPDASGDQLMLRQLPELLLGGDHPDVIALAS